MLNYGEEIAYWYLRFNGFFLIDNFVVHKSDNVEYSSDVDLLALRLPYVYEKVGGQSNDWDAVFFKPFNKELPIGILCEVKTGNFENCDLFKPDNVSYAVGRFGFTPDVEVLVPLVQRNAITTGSGFQIAKVLFSKKPPQKSDRFFHFPIIHLQEFLQDRIRKYNEKHRDRMFFSSNLIQYLTDV